MKLNVVLRPSIVLLIPLSWMSAAVAGDRSADDAQMRRFENEVRPLLIKRCYECHSEEKAEGGLRLDVADAISKGGDSGAAVIPGNPGESLLVSAIRYEELEMPPDAPLSDEEKTLLERWVAEGAYWPIGKPSTSSSPESSSEPWWAAQPIDPGNVPVSLGRDSWETEIDGYVDAKLEAAGLQRAPLADRATLIRRLSYDLLGLPPSPEAIDAFVNDQRPDAYIRLVDQMFADPAYGERMARLWLDLVRYAESDGWRADAYRPQAWRYRDFVIDAFNSGMPYDQFVSMQLAGDELSPGDPGAMAAVGFMRLGIYEFNQRNAEGQWQDIVDEITDVTADVFLATGLACAKCHDHKFDPIPRGDYFRMRSVFEPLLFIDQKLSRRRSDKERAEIDRLIAELQAIEGDAVKALGDGAVDKFPLNVQAMYRKSPAQRNSYEHQMAYLVARQVIDEGLKGNNIEKKIGKEATEKRNKILAELSKLGADPYAPADLMTIADSPGRVRPTRLPGRSKGLTFEPAAPSIFVSHELKPRSPIDAPQSSGRRSALARWITSHDNPITARVMVNRLWQYHFDRGLVDSPNDFGRLGTPPSHPRLLDFLAQRFMDSDWDIQAIQRMIVTSATYRQAAVSPQSEQALLVDAGNRLLWHHPVRRLDAEQFRDSLLVVMGTLQNRLGGPSVAGAPPRRSIYLQRKRNSSDEMLGRLDAPPGLVGTARRDVTVTAPQSLMMLNNTRILNVAKKFAARTRADVQQLAAPKQPEAFVRRAHRLIAGTEAADETVALLSELAGTGPQGEVDVCHVLLNSNAFLFVE